jgi:hypothetical protein
MCVEQGRLSVSGGIVGENFKGTLSFVHCRYTLVLSPRAYISVNVAGVGRRRTSELD